MIKLILVDWNIKIFLAISCILIDAAVFTFCFKKTSFIRLSI